MELRCASAQIFGCRTSRVEEPRVEYYSDREFVIEAYETGGGKKSHDLPCAVWPPMVTVTGGTGRGSGSDAGFASTLVGAV